MPIPCTGVAALAVVALGARAQYRDASATPLHGHETHLTAAAAPARVAATKGFASPEAVIFDRATDFYYVSNVGGPVGIKDGKGFISRVSPDGKIDSLHFLQNGVGGVTLNGPMGSRVRGDTLFVLDINVLRSFDLRTGKSLGTIDFSALHPHILNDFDWGPDGAIYVTDMGMNPNPHGQPTPGAPMRILKAVPGRAPVVALASKALDTPDGIAWDATGSRFVITPFGGDTVLAWKPGETAPKPIAAGKGKFDGVEVESGGAVLLTSWSSGAVFQLSGDHLVPLVQGLTSPSDVTMDTHWHRLGITEMNPGAFQVWDMNAGMASR